MCIRDRDGTKELHDNTRLDAKGKGTWNRVTAALHVLQKHDVEVNLLCVVCLLYTS